MRNFSRILSLALVTAMASSAFAREIDERHENTSLTATPVGSTSASQPERRLKKEPTVVAPKYDVMFPVRDRGHVFRERGAI